MAYHHYQDYTDATSSATVASYLLDKSFQKLRQVRLVLQEDSFPRGAFPRLAWIRFVPKPRIENNRVRDALGHEVSARRKQRLGTRYSSHVRVAEHPLLPPLGLREFVDVPAAEESTTFGTA